MLKPPVKLGVHSAHENFSGCLSSHKGDFMKISYTSEEYIYSEKSCNLLDRNHFSIFILHFKSSLGMKLFHSVENIKSDQVWIYQHFTSSLGIQIFLVIIFQSLFIQGLNVTILTVWVILAGSSWSLKCQKIYFAFFS